ncbi:MAG: protein kinase domain-containing protein [Myxococcota bacterium]
MNTIEFGKYQLLEKIGQGGMAEVFYALSRGQGGFTKEVALKRVLAHLGEDPDFVKSFFDEARLGGLLNHHHIVQTLEFGQEQGIHYLAMEYVHGVTLRQVINYHNKNGQPIPPAIVVELLLQLFDGLRYAHKAEDEYGNPLNMVHRDLKPTNILVSNFGAIKIADFGIARAETNLRRTTYDGVLKGTAQYMSPEQALGDLRIDQRSDIFSMGSIAYEMVTLRPLFFDPSNSIKTLRNVQEAQVGPSLAAMVQENAYSQRMAPLLEWMLQREVARRPAQIDDVIPELRRLQTQLPRTIDTQTWIEQLMVGLGKPVKSRRSTASRISVPIIAPPTQNLGAMVSGQAPVPGPVPRTAVAVPVVNPASVPSSVPASVAPAPAMAQTGVAGAGFGTPARVPGAPVPSGASQPVPPAARATGPFSPPPARPAGEPSRVPSPSNLPLAGPGAGLPREVGPGVARVAPAPFPGQPVTRPPTPSAGMTGAPAPMSSPMPVTGRPILTALEDDERTAFSDMIELEEDEAVNSTVAMSLQPPRGNPFQSDPVIPVQKRTGSPEISPATSSADWSELRTTAINLSDAPPDIKLAAPVRNLAGASAGLPASPSRVVINPVPPAPAGGVAAPKMPAAGMPGASGMGASGMGATGNVGAGAARSTAQMAMPPASAAAQDDWSELRTRAISPDERFMSRTAGFGSSDETNPDPFLPPRTAGPVDWAGMSTRDPRPAISPGHGESSGPGRVPPRAAGPGASASAPGWEPAPLPLPPVGGASRPSAPAQGGGMGHPGQVSMGQSVGSSQGAQARPSQGMAGAPIPVAPTVMAPAASTSAPSTSQTPVRPLWQMVLLILVLLVVGLGIILKGLQ